MNSAEEKIKEGSEPVNKSISSKKEERLEGFFCKAGGFLGLLGYLLLRSLSSMSKSGNIVMAVCLILGGVFIGSVIYRYGKRIGQMRAFKGTASILTKEIYLSKRLHINCPHCGRSLKGATREMIGDTGVCPKCKAEFVIEQKQ